MSSVLDDGQRTRRRERRAPHGKGLSPRSRVSLTGRLHASLVIARRLATAVHSFY